MLKRRSPMSVSARGHYFQRSSKIFSTPVGREMRPEFKKEETDKGKPSIPIPTPGPMPSHYRDKIVREMKLRGLSESSIDVYVNSLKCFMRRFRGKTPSKITLDDIETYVLELIERKQSHRYINIQVTAIRFFYSAVCEPCFHVADLPKLKERRKLPKIFSRGEVKAITVCFREFCRFADSLDA